MRQPVRIGQIWAHPGYSHRWRIHSIRGGTVLAELAYPDAKGEFLFDGHAHSIGEIDEHGCCDGFRGEWIIVEGGNQIFSKVNPKTLRKRARDQMAQRVLSGGDPSPNVVKT